MFAVPLLWYDTGHGGFRKVGSMSYLSLKSGTDVRGCAVAHDGLAVELTDEAVYDITAAFVCWLVDQKEKSAEEMTVALGHDSRISADRIATAAKKALTESGVKVLDCCLASTPAMFMTTVFYHTDAAVQITASHHPYDRNGLKFFTPQGGLNSSDLSAILQKAEEKEFYIPKQRGEVVPTDLMTDYSASLREMICKATDKTEQEQPLKGYHIVVDAGNGAGGFYATQVLQKLGADITGSQFLEPDGMFPNHIPNPENETAMASICHAVTAHKADLGIIFDTDVDRAGCVGKDGKEINRNRLIALAAGLASQGHPGATIVTDSVTSDGLKVFLEENLGLHHYRYRRGYKNVIDKAIELCGQGVDCPLAIETSGHAALKENYFLDDGAYLVTRIVIELARGVDVDRFLEPLAMPVEERECRLSILSSDFRTYGESVIEALERYAANEPTYRVADDNREGVRVSTPDGWFLLRLSVHDPVMPMNFESDTVGGIDRMIRGIKNFFAPFDQLDTSSLG